MNIYSYNVKHIYTYQFSLLMTSKERVHLLVRPEHCIPPMRFQLDIQPRPEPIAEGHLLALRFLKSVQLCSVHAQQCLAPPCFMR